MYYVSEPTEERIDPARSQLIVRQITSVALSLAVPEFLTPVLTLPPTDSRTELDHRCYANSTDRHTRSPCNIDPPPRTHSARSEKLASSRPARPSLSLRRHIAIGVVESCCRPRVPQLHQTSSAANMTLTSLASRSRTSRHTPSPRSCLCCPSPDGVRNWCRGIQT